MLKSYLFNQKRNKFKLDVELEKNMLLEEVREFYMALDMAERVDAVIDVEYVMEGSMMKFNFAGKNIDPELFTTYKEFTTVAYAILREEFGGNQQIMEKVMADCVKIVEECNAMKTANLDENGKVRKEQEGMKLEIPDATQLIREKLISADLMVAE